MLSIGITISSSHHLVLSALLHPTTTTTTIFQHLLPHLQRTKTHSPEMYRLKSNWTIPHPLCPSYLRRTRSLRRARPALSALLERKSLIPHASPHKRLLPKRRSRRPNHGCEGCCHCRVEMYVDDSDNPLGNKKWLRQGEGRFRRYRIRRLGNYGLADEALNCATEALKNLTLFRHQLKFTTLSKTCIISSPKKKTCLLNMHSQTH